MISGGMRSKGEHYPAHHLKRHQLGEALASKKRFTVVVEGLPPDKIASIWSDLCQPSKKPSPDFLAVYPKMTLLMGNKFRFIDGNPEQISGHLARLLQSSANGGTVKTIVEK